jgi:hypothetical protein
MRYLFLLFFGYLVYRYLIKPLFLGINERTSFRNNPQDGMAEMLRRMQEFQRQQYEQQFQQQQQQQTTVKKQPKSKSNDGEYIDYEEIE